jgi:retron-type reverse transcriptase
MALVREHLADGRVLRLIEGFLKQGVMECGELAKTEEDEPQGTLQGGVISPLLANSHFDFLGYRFKRSRSGKMMHLVRPKSLSKLRESIRPRTRRTNGQSMNAIVADLNRTLVGWYAYFKHVKDSELAAVDGWIRMRLRSILRKRRGGKGRGHGSDHQRWPR